MRVICILLHIVHIFHCLPISVTQDSVDVYHDAFSTLQRVRLNSFGRCERKRHASLGTEPVEMEPVEDSTETTGTFGAFVHSAKT